MRTTSLGRAAEAAVAEYLTSQGFSVIAQNWRTRWCEIDIIAQQGKIVYFVEVKYRSNAVQGSGFEYIGQHKQRQLRFAVDYWIAQNGWDGDCRLYGAEVTGYDRQNIELVEID
jgi:uncharacterized protein (TIGR00252 family)